MYGRGSIFPSFAVLIPFIIIKILATVTTQPRPMMEPAMLATALTTARSKPCFAWYIVSMAGVADPSTTRAFSLIPRHSATSRALYRGFISDL